MDKDKTFVVIDIETTGLNSNPDVGEVDHIIEVGAVKIATAFNLIKEMGAK